MTRPIALSRDGRHGGAKSGWGEEPLRYAVRDASGPRTFMVPGTEI